MSETCEPDSPHLITHVETTAAPSTDNLVLDKIHAALAQKECLPREHLVDTGYTSAEQLVACQVGYGIELIGPVRADLSWQAKANQGFDATAFEIDWHNQTARCPAGQTSTKWKHGQDDHGNHHIKILFRQKTCTHCDFAPDCTQDKTGRSITVHPQAEHEALLQARANQKTEAFRQKYALRAGVEGTIAQAVQAFEMRRCRYRGLVKTHLQHVITATAMNLVQIADWLRGEPFARTRTSHFAVLADSA
jgi:transposase